MTAAQPIAQTIPSISIDIGWASLKVTSTVLTAVDTVTVLGVVLFLQAVKLKTKSPIESVKKSECFMV
jgi:hypothetical protein